MRIRNIEHDQYNQLALFMSCRNYMVKVKRHPNGRETPFLGPFSSAQASLSGSRNCAFSSHLCLGSREHEDLAVPA